LPAIFRKIDGRYGRIEVPFLGALIGNINSWTLTRRADRGPDSELFDLHAALSFVNEAMFHDPDYEKVVFVRGGKGQEYRLEQVSGQRTVLQGRSLIMERVTLCRIEPK
jgi:hypothetical protein